LIKRFPSWGSFRNRVGLFTLGVFIMSMVIGTNVASLTAQRHLNNSRNDMETSMERLSSGNRINSAMDDAAGLTVAHKMESKITGLDQAVRNANDGLSLIGVAEGALEEISSMLNRMKELSVQGVNDTYSAADRTAMSTEFASLRDEIERVSTATDFNGVSVLNSSTALAIQVGDSASDTINITPQDMGKASIGGGADVVVQAATAAVSTVAGASAEEVSTQTMAAALTADKVLTLDIEGVELTQAWDTSAAVTLAKMAEQVQALGTVLTAVAGTGTNAATTLITITGANDGDSITQSAMLEVTAGGNLSSTTITTSALAASAITNVDAAIADVDSYRASLGASANKLDHVVTNLMSRSEHTSGALSRIQDTDYAVESANLAKAQVLQQAGTAMLAQANASGQSVLSLLK
jgi:flagellin